MNTPSNGYLVGMMCGLCLSRPLWCRMETLPLCLLILHKWDFVLRWLQMGLRVLWVCLFLIVGL